MYPCWLTTWRYKLFWQGSVHFDIFSIFTKYNMGPQALVRNAHFSHQQPWLIILNHQCLIERKMVAVPMKMFEEKGRLFH